MNKTCLEKRKPLLLGLQTLLAASSLLQAAPVANWVTTNGNTGFSGGSAATASPITTDADGDTIAANFTAITLADGDAITLSGSVQFNASLAGTEFRIGLFDGDNPVTAGDGNGYVGFYASAPTTSTVGLFSANGTQTNPFSSSAASQKSTMSAGGSAAANTSLAFSLTITRVGANVNLSANIAGGSYSSSGSALLVAPSPGSFTYDSAAFLMGGGLNATQATFSNIQVTQATTSDSDSDDMPDAYETAHGLNPAVNDAALSLDSDSLTNLQEYQGADGTPGTGDETLPENPDTDGDGDPDDLEVTNATDPNDPLSKTGVRLFGIDFNRNDELNSPSQSLFRTISGSTVQASNTSSYTKTIGPSVITVSQPASEALEFRGGNSDSSRAIPGGDTSLSFLAADFVATKKGAIQLQITNLPAGDYFFRSWHIEPFNESNLGYAQGSSSTTPNTVEARVGGVLKDSVTTTALGSSGLNTTFINDSQIPSLGFALSHGGGSLFIDLTSTLSNGSNTFLLLNGFEIYQSAP